MQDINLIHNKSKYVCTPFSNTPSFVQDLCAVSVRNAGGIQWKLFLLFRTQVQRRRLLCTRMNLIYSLRFYMFERHAENIFFISNFIYIFIWLFSMQKDIIGKVFQRFRDEVNFLYAISTL